jgi:hypothetical protein
MDRRQFIKRASGLLIPLAAPAIILRPKPALASTTVFTATPNSSNGGDDGLSYRMAIARVEIHWGRFEFLSKPLLASPP